ncbi:MAG: hypothetical protein HC933_17970 [Pleurocapsa sp. SU_196_0]|nr:hypothetical protein [Pleurocapsa sp. SU_196_0]
MRRGWLGLVVVLLLASSAEAHVKWFYEGGRPPLQWDALLNPVALAVMIGVVVIVAALFVLQRARGGRGLLPRCTGSARHMSIARRCSD